MCVSDSCYKRSEGDVKFVKYNLKKDLLEFCALMQIIIFTKFKYLIYICTYHKRALTVPSTSVTSSFRGCNLNIEVYEMGRVKMDSFMQLKGVVLELTYIFKVSSNQCQCERLPSYSVLEERSTLFTLQSQK